MNAKTHTLLLVDDDERLASLLQRYLGEHGFELIALPDGRELLSRLTPTLPALLILDVMLPGEDGLSLLRRVRAQHESLPVLMLTARAEDIDRILGLEMGADDYLAKPFNPRELLARIHAILRRSQVAPAPAAAAIKRFGLCQFDSARRVLIRQGEETVLTNAEVALLTALTDHPKIPLSRNQLMDLAFGRNHEVFDRSIDVHISRLRKLVEPDPKQPQHIQTVWGFGYVFQPGA